MASIVKRGKSYSVAYYEGEGKNKKQVWESGLSYTAAKSRKATIEYEMSQNIHVDSNDITVSEFLYEFIEKYGSKKWVASTYDGNVGYMKLEIMACMLLKFGTFQLKLMISTQ